MASHMPNFKNEALCASNLYSPDWWFVEDEEGNPSNDLNADNRFAVVICKMCPARQECLAFSLKYGDMDGIWGGFNKVSRKRLQKKLNITPINLPMTYPSPVTISKKVIDAE